MDGLIKLVGQIKFILEWTLYRVYSFFILTTRSRSYKRAA